MSKNELMIGGEAFKIENAAEYLKKTEEAIKAIKGAEDEDESVKGKSLPGFGEISNINDISELIKAYSSVSGKEKAYEEAAKEMGLSKTPAFKIEGVSADVWKKAILRREVIASSSAKLERLEKVKVIMTDMLSKEEKQKAKLRELDDILGELS